MLASMTKTKFAQILQDLADLHSAADDGAMEVAKGYKSLKKQGINLDALKLVRKLRGYDNPAKVQAFLADFDKFRELAGFDDQQNLFEEDKTKPQKDAESDKLAVTPAEPVAVDPPAKKPAKTGAKGGGKAAAAKAALFDTGDGPSDASVH
ncbi:MAG: hypothetical protein WCP82_05015 [Alphaproteobacteria bacterium]